jgi:pre-mRNA-splicing factor ATP-dependent RNA helicase DHX15/PRP43
MQVARRVAEEMDVRLGSEVGYNVRFDKKMSNSTKLAYYTDGMLLREFFRRPNLTGVAAIIIDEAHERTADTDLLMGLIKELMRQRTDIKIIIMSATLDVQVFSDFFGSPPCISVPGRMFDVNILYTTAPVSDYVEAAVEGAIRIHRGEPQGDVLVFLTGEAEIERAVREVTSRLTPDEAVALPLYGSLSMEDQTRVFRPAGVRKIIFSTNIAETSLTIDGVVYVIDGMHQKESLHDVTTNVAYLFPTQISKASAQQRAGRAGRTRPGKCFRLITEADFNRLPDHSFPEMSRMSVTSLMLALLRVGYTNPVRFPLITPPSQHAFISAISELDAHGAATSTDDGGIIITEMGKLLVELPLSLQQSSALLRSCHFGCSADVVVILSVLASGGGLSGRTLRREIGEERRRQFEHPHGDYLTMFNVFHAFLANNQTERWCNDNGFRYLTLLQAVRVYSQLTDMINRLGLPLTSVLTTPTVGGTCSLATQRFAEDGLSNVERGLVSGFYSQSAVLLTNTDVYTVIKTGVTFKLHKDSVLMHCGAPLPKWIIFDKLERALDNSGVVCRGAMRIEPTSLMEANDAYFAPTEINGAVRGVVEEQYNLFQEMYEAQMRGDNAE